MRAALIRYRIMAYVVGCLLVVLVCVGLPLKYGPWDNETVVLWTAIPHGWLYMILLITAFDLGRRARWSWRRLILIALAGTIPFLSFVAERSATKDVRAKLATQEQDALKLAAATEADSVYGSLRSRSDPPQTTGDSSSTCATERVASSCRTGVARPRKDPNWARYIDLLLN